MLVHDSKDEEVVSIAGISGLGFCGGELGKGVPGGDYGGLDYKGGLWQSVRCGYLIVRNDESDSVGEERREGTPRKLCPGEARASSGHG